MTPRSRVCKACSLPRDNLVGLTSVSILMVILVDMDQFEEMINNLQSDMLQRYIKHDDLVEFRQKLQMEKFQMYDNHYKEQSENYKALKEKVDALEQHVETDCYGPL